MFISFQCINILLLGATLPLHYYLGGEQAHRSNSALYLTYAFLGKSSYYLLPVLWICLLRFWLQKRKAGKTLWFMRRHTEVLKLIAITAFVISGGMAYLAYYVCGIYPAKLPFYLIALFHNLYKIALILVWLWWMDQVYTGPRARLWVVGVWVGSTTVFGVYMQTFLIINHNSPIYSFQGVAYATFNDLIYGGAAIFFLSLYQNWREKKAVLTKR